MSRRNLGVLWASCLGFALMIALVTKSQGQGSIRDSFRDLPLRFNVTEKAAPAESASPKNPAASATVRARLIEAYGKLPLHFEPNRGQSDKRVKFVSRGRGYTLFLTSTEAVLAFTDRAGAQCGHGAEMPHAHTSPQAAPPSPTATLSMEVVRLRLDGMNAAPRVRGLEPLSGNANYFIGKDPREWHTRIPIYAKVRYQQVYPGIDLVYYGNQGELEYDFVLAPGADPGAIRFSLQGADELKLNAQGDLVLWQRGRELRFHKPRLYQELDGKEQEVFGRYVLTASRQVGFQVAPYDRSRPLMIDPVLSYSTYLGGGSVDQGNDIAVDSSGNAYITGFTASNPFPTSSGALDASYGGGGGDVFVTKLSANGNSLVYSTYLGGSAADQGTSIAVDATGNAFITGETFSSAFPTTAGALQGTYGGSGDAFIAKLSANGSSLVYSTYFGGSGVDEAFSIAVDSGDNAYITGKTYSTNFPTQSALQLSNNGGEDAFVSEFNASGSLVYSTYLGGSGDDQGSSIAIDTLGDAYVTGFTTSTNFPTANPVQMACKSCPNINDAFVAEISPNGAGLVYSTYLGGSGDDQGMGIAVDAAGNAYVTGFTFSTDFPTTAGAFQGSLSGTGDAFVTEVATNGTSLRYSTYLGGNQYTYGRSIAVLNGNAYVAGVTSTSNFPLVSAIQSNPGGVVDAFVSEFNATGSALSFSTYLGGSSYDEANAIALDTTGNMYLTGKTESTNFPTAGAFQASYGGGGSDAFASKIAVPVSVTLSPNALTFASQAMGTTSNAQAVTLTNSQNTALTISSIAITGTNSGDFTANYTTTTPPCPISPSTLAAGANCVINITFTPAASGTRTGTLTVTDNASNSPQSASLTGTGAASSVTLSPNPVPNFGSVTVNMTSSPQTVTLTNTGGGAVTINSISITGTNAVDFAQTNNCPISPNGTLAGNTSCAISVTFTPGASGTRTATLSVSDNAAGSPQTDSLTGSGVASNVSLSPTSLTYTGQMVNTTSASQSVTFTNPGPAPVTISSISLGGTNPGDFARDYTNTTSPCPINPSMLAGNSSCVINVTFTPTASGTRSAILSINDNAAGSPQTVNLSGTGMAPAVSLSSTSLNFGKVPRGNTSAPKSVTLTNTGTAALTITNITVTGNNSADFSETSGCISSSPLAVNANCTITVTFKPSVTGSETAAVVVTDNALNSPQQINLKGSGK